MRRFRASARTKFVRGFAVMFPVYMLVAILSWITDWIGGAVGPIATLIQLWTDVPLWVAKICAFALAMAIVFLAGFLVGTPLGFRAIEAMNRVLFRKIPFYELVRATAERFFGSHETSLEIPPASRIVLFQPFHGNTWSIGFVTRERHDWSFVLWPFSPVPTGRVLIVENARLISTTLTTVEAMKIGMSLGSGATDEICRKIEHAMESRKKPL